MKLTFIYLTENEKSQCYKVCQKYKVSLSTLADVIIFVTYYCLEHYAINKNMLNDLQQDYISKNGNQKTSIKPKCYKVGEAICNLVENKNIFASNVLKIYINKRVDDFITEKGKNHYYNIINEKLNQIREQFWDYNNFVRMQNRNLKYNKEYYKRRIEQLEGNS